MKKEIIIFLSNKLLSLDTILPIILNFNKEKKLKVIFYVFNLETFNAIKKNIILYQAISDTGKLMTLGKYTKNTPSGLRKLSILTSLIKLIITAQFYKKIFIHFKALEYYPLRLLFLFNRKNCILMEPNCWGHTKSIDAAYNIDANRNLDALNEPRYTAYTYLATFSDDWAQVNFFNYQLNNKKKIFYLPPTRADKNWIKYCKKISLELKNKNNSIKKIYNNKKSILFLLGPLGKIISLDNKTNGEHLFVKTIKAIKKVPNSFIVIKPHVNSDVQKAKKILKQLNFKSYAISYLHVSVLANYCKFAISNYMSLALIDAWVVGIPCIEYTKYHPMLLKVTHNKSLYPEFIDYFLENKPYSSLTKVLLKDVKPKYRFPKPKFINYNDACFLDKLNLN